jgi:hypothetical protein
MKTTITTKKYKHAILKYMSVLLLAMFFSPASALAADKAKVTVFMNAEGCPIYTRTDAKNCDTDGDHKKDKSCRKQGDRIWWEVADMAFPRQIVIEFDSTNPLNGCDLTAVDGKITGCKIVAETGDFKYGISAAGDCPLDPRIIVR